MRIFALCIIHLDSKSDLYNVATRESERRRCTNGDIVCYNAIPIKQLLSRDYPNAPRDDGKAFQFYFRTPTKFDWSLQHTAFCKIFVMNLFIKNQQKFFWIKKKKQQIQLLVCKISLNICTTPSYNNITRARAIYSCTKTV